MVGKTATATITIIGATTRGMTTATMIMDSGVPSTMGAIRIVTGVTIIKGPTPLKTLV